MMKHLNRIFLSVVSLLYFASLPACAQGGPGTSPSNPLGQPRPQSQPQAQTQQIIQGRVVGIADGDTITVLDSSNTQHRIRLQGIDAPESRQAFGTRSRQNLSDLVFNRQVTVEYNSRDRYQRVLGKILVEGRDANLEQVRAGMAWMYRQYADQLSAADRTAYEQAETEARATRRGLWADENPTPPWDYRREGRSTSTNNSGNENSGNRPPIVSVRVTPTTSMSTEQIVGNRRSRIYHEPNCPNYNDVSPQNRVTFNSRQEAEAAGYRRARNCP
jgi:endonuclease YncB( thermonuclease family)